MNMILNVTEMKEVTTNDNCTFPFCIIIRFLWTNILPSLFINLDDEFTDLINEEHYSSSILRINSLVTRELHDELHDIEFSLGERSTRLADQLKITEEEGPISTAYARK